MLDSLAIVGAFADLTPNQREAYIDHVVLYRTHAEIGETLGVTPQRVNQLIRTAGEKLRESLASEYVASGRAA